MDTDHDRWNLIRSIFDRAVQVPRNDREALVTKLCKGDESMRSEIMDLLRADTEAETFLGGVAIDIVGRDTDETLESESRIGPFRIVKPIGRGGMGRVYLAERADGSFQQQVALKLLNRSDHSDRVAQRFQMERQILARLQHPNISRLLDGGVTSSGAPYFAMEYVEGKPIDEHCDANRLTIDERLDLFHTVCNAVHYAHQNLVVHRDLKPANILVTADGTVKLLDFGIAKILTDDSLDDSDDLAFADLTQTGESVMTPAYASPEQVRGDDITTATDVYALGALLYELLTGRRPFEKERPLHELRQLILAADPDRPSTAVSKVAPVQPSTTGESKATIDTVSLARSTRYERLRRRLSGDLDNICLKALRKEPERRYSSAEQLASDVHRHIVGLPVTARPDTVTYRTRKFVSRHRVSTGLALAAATTIVALTGFYTQRLQTERDVARIESAKSAEVIEFMRSIFENVDPAEARGQDLSARELLDLGAERLSTDLANQPAVQGTMFLTLGSVYYELGLEDESERLLNEGLEVLQRVYEEPNAEITATRLSLGLIYQDRGEVERADSVYSRVYREKLALTGPRHDDIAEIQSAMAFLAETRGDYQTADSLFRAVLSLSQNLHEAEHPRVVHAMVKLGQFLRTIDKPGEAEPLLREALALQEKYYDGDHVDIASTKRQLAGILRVQRKYPEAESLYVQALRTRRKMLGENHIEVANTLNSYATLLADQDLNERAIELNKEMVRILEINHDGPHPSMGAAYNNLALMLQDVGQLDEAINYFNKTIEIQEAVLEEGHPHRAFPLNGISGVLKDKGDYVAAESYLRRSYEIRTNALPPDHRHLIDTLSDIGDILRLQKRFVESESALTEAYASFNEHRGADDIRTQRTANRLSLLYREMGNNAEADRFAELAPEYK